MFAHLVKKPTGYICNNCRMKQDELKEECWFCGYFFSNWEVIKIEEFLKENNN